MISMEVEKDIIVKHNVKSATLLGVMTALGVFWILFAIEGLALYIQTGEASVEASVAVKELILNLFVCVIAGGLTIFLNCKVRRLVISGNKFVYRNVFGREKEIAKEKIVEMKRKDGTYLVLFDNNGKAFCTLEDNMKNISCLIQNDEDFLGVYEEFQAELQRQEETFKSYVLQKIQEFDNSIISEITLIRDERKVKDLFLIHVRAMKDDLGYFSDHMQLQPCEHVIPFAGYDHREKKGYFLQQNKYQNEVNQLEEWLSTLIKRNCFCRVRNENYHDR